MLRNISERISSGSEEIGHGGGGEKSVAGGAEGMDSWENWAISSVIVGRGPSREWCAGLSTVGEALDGLVFVGVEILVVALVGFDGADDGGKCLALYASCT